MLEIVPVPLRILDHNIWYDRPIDMKERAFNQTLKKLG